MQAMKADGKLQVQFPRFFFFTSVRNGGEFSPSRPYRFSPGKCSRWALNRSLGGPQSLSSCLGGESLASAGIRIPVPIEQEVGWAHIRCGENKYPLHLPGFGPWHPLHRKQAGWTPESVLTLWRSEKCLVPVVNRIPDRPAHSLVT